MSYKSSYTGRTRIRTTRKSVLLLDRLSSVLIRVGGIGTIVAVLGVCLFLLWVVLPLLSSPRVESERQVPISDSRNAGEILQFGVDEFQRMGWFLLADGTVQVIQLADGTRIAERQAFEGRSLTAASLSNTDDDAAFGFADGTIQLGEIGFQSRFLDPAELPDPVRARKAEEFPIVHEGGLLTITPQGQYRLETLQVELQEPVRITTGVPITHIAHSIRPTGPVFAVLTQDRQLTVTTVRERKNFMTGKVTYTPANAQLPYQVPEGKEAPAFLRISGLGDNLFLIWRDGYTIRYDTRDLNHPAIAETLHLVEGNKATETPGIRITALEYLIGKSTLVVGDSSGRLRAWFRTKPPKTRTSDGTTLVMAHELPAAGVPVTSLSASSRTRMLAAGYEDGRVRLFNVTNNYLMKEMNPESSAPVVEVKIAPKDDGILAVAGEGIRQWKIDPLHPEVTLRSIFLPVWYEGYNQPEHVWQSSSGTDQFEPKFGMMPLIFGTVKATVYSMVFGLPLALLAAVYTSEFLHPRMKSSIKPMIEMMASLPSVVLGFLAALVFAPLVENWIPTVLVSFIVIPFTFLLGAHLWQTLPRPLGIRLSRFRLPVIAICLPLGLILSIALGPRVEDWLFAGEIKTWLDGQVGSGLGGWMMLFIPLCAVLVAVLNAQLVNAWVRRNTKTWSHAGFALFNSARFIVGCSLVPALAWLFSWMLVDLGMDPRGSYVDTYVQRNALVVGFVMGFAIIPIIYTIAEDALSSVPEHLRSASLGCGATPWQTATRIIIPTAMSGLFSAAMIGLGRAVGETMIVLMAAGNTPVLDWNVFNGFRTLSANIAVELPEAVRNSTHYRTLFLAALILFVMTFILNTVAEIIRLRFRKRAFEL